MEQSLPTNCGKRWTDSENEQLLKCIQDKINIHEIAGRHERTVGGIRSQIRKLAADFWYVQKKSMEEITCLTGLTETEIKDTIERRKSSYSNKEIKQSKSVIRKQKYLSETNEIQALKEKIEVMNNEMQEMKKMFLENRQF